MYLSLDKKTQIYVKCLLKYDIIVALILLNEFEFLEKYEDCYCLKNAIIFHNDFLFKDYPTKLNESFLNEEKKQFSDENQFNEYISGLNSVVEDFKKKIIMCEQKEKK